MAFHLGPAVECRGYGHYGFTRWGSFVMWYVASQTQAVLNITNRPKHHCAVMFRTASDVAPARTGGCCVQGTTWHLNTLHTAHITPHTSTPCTQDPSKTISNVMRQHGASGSRTLHTGFTLPSSTNCRRPFSLCMPACGEGLRATFGHEPVNPGPFGTGVVCALAAP